MTRCLSNKWVLVLIAILAFTLGPALTARAANLAAGKLAFASYNNPIVGNGTDATANLTDNNFGTSWSDTGSVTAPADQAGVDLGAVTAFRYVRLNWTADHPTALTVEVADTVDTDPTSFGYGTGDWSVVYTRLATDAQPNIANDFIDVGAQNHRYVRVNGTTSSNTTSNNWGINEFQVLDVAPGITGTALFGASPVGDTIVQLNGPTAVTGGPPMVIQNIKTDSTGVFNFTGLYDGTYLLVGLPAGKYAPIQANVVVSGGTPITQNLTFVTAVVNSAATTAPLPGYLQDDIGNVGEANSGSATSNGYILPSDELPVQPVGDGIWNTGDPNGGFPASATAGIGPKVPAGLHFWFPPYASGRNNVLTPANATVPVPKAHYTALYVVQGASGTTGGSYDCQAFLNYTDGTVQPILTVGGTSTYHITDGTQTQNEDEFNAFTVDKRILASNGTATPETNVPPAYRVFMRFILVDSTKFLKSITFGQGFTSNSTTVSGFVYAWSGDVLATDTVPAVGSISGTVKAPASEGSGPVKNAIVEMYTYRATTDATGAYSFRGLPPDTYTVSALKPANYPLTSVSHPLAAGANDTVDIQFPYPVPVITDALTNPNLDEASSDDPTATATVPGLFADFSATAYGLGSEFMPHGKYSPNSVANPPVDPARHNGSAYTNWEATPGAPGALSFDFGDPTKDSPVAPGVAGYPLGGTPNMVCIHDMEILGPQTNVLNAYLAITGLDGAINMTATLHYTDGTSEVKQVQVSDWYQPPSTNEYPYVTMHGRHTNGTGRTPPWEDGVGGTGTPPAAAANIFIKALVIPCNSAKALHDITFDHGDQSRRFPIVSAISWETANPSDPSSDIRITVTKSDSTPAAGAWVVMGPYSTMCDASGVAIFKGMPAHQVVNLGAFLYGQTKQATVVGHIVPTGLKMPAPDDVSITLPAVAPSFIQLPLAYDYDMIAMSDAAGDYKGAANNDRGFNGDLMPPSNTIVQDARTNNIPFLMPHKETWYPNVQRMNGQTWKVVPGHYSNFSFLVTGQGVGDFSNCRYNHLTLTYADGSSDQVQVANHDWVGNYSAPGTTAVRGFYYREQPITAAPNPQDIGLNIRSRRNGDSDEFRNPDSTAAFTQELVPVDAAKTLVSITWPNLHMAPNGTGLQGFSDNDFSILAVTMEANDTDAAVTLTGRVIGQPAGASAVGPIGLAKVIADDAHMAFTAADGTFSLPNVPTSTTSLTVVPLGQGILTKTFPVTLTAPATAVGDLNVGTSQRYIYAILGSTNNENGLHLVTPNSVPYAYDTSRPNYKVNDPLAVTSPIVIGGKAARQNRGDNVSPASDHYYFKVDPGWLWHGRMGDPGTLPIVSADGKSVITPGIPGTGPGMDLSTFVAAAAAPLTGSWKLAPKIYMFIEYYDNAKPGQTDDVFYLAYNKLEGWVHNSTSTTWNIPGGAVGSAVSHRMTFVEATVAVKNAAGTGTQQLNVVKGSTNTWKTFTYELNPIQNQNPIANNLAFDAFGCYGGGRLGADFKLDCWYKTANGGDNPDIIRSVIISLDPSIPTLPATPSGRDALKIAAGLQAADSSTLAADDIVTPKPLITIQDAIALAKQGLK